MSVLRWGKWPDSSYGVGTAYNHGTTTMACGVTVHRRTYGRAPCLGLGTVDGHDAESEGAILIPLEHVETFIAMLQDAIAGPLGKLAIEAERKANTTVGETDA